MKLPGETIERLCSVLRDAFPSAHELEALTRFRFGEKLNDVTSESRGLAERVFTLVQWMEATTVRLRVIQPVYTPSHAWTP